MMPDQFQVWIPIGATYTNGEWIVLWTKYTSTDGWKFRSGKINVPVVEGTPDGVRPLRTKRGD